jgi:hypothetical protein
MVKAQPLESQLIDWLHTFQPDAPLRRLILDTIHAETDGHSGEDAARRRELLTQLERLRDLYLMGDLTKAQYIMRRQTLHEEIQRTQPPTDPDLGHAQALLENFARFWETETDPAERRKLLTALFEHIWQKDGTIIAIKPHAAFARYFTAATQAQAKHPKGNPDNGVTKAGATGLEPAASGVTGRRSNQLSYAPAWAEDVEEDPPGRPRAFHSMPTLR